MRARYHTGGVYLSSLPAGGLHWGHPIAVMVESLCHLDGAVVASDDLRRLPGRGYRLFVGLLLDPLVDGLLLLLPAEVDTLRKNDAGDPQIGINLY